MKKLALLITMILSVTVIAFFGCSTSSSDSSGGFDSAKETDLLNQINAMRSTPLTLDPAITAVARSYANVFGPAGTYPYAPNHDSKTIQQRLTEGSVTYTSAAEEGYCEFPANGNIATAISNMSSATLTSSAYTRVGIAVRSYY